MSFFTTPVSSTAATTPLSPTPRAARPAAPAPAPGGDSVTVDTLSASPPPEVLDAIGVAAQAADRLQQSGRRLQFTVDPPTGRVAVQVTDHSGNVLGALTGAQALAVASGVPLT
jgi:hypothetical protein